MKHGVCHLSPIAAAFGLMLLSFVLDQCLAPPATVALTPRLPVPAIETMMATFTPPVPPPRPKP